MAARMHVSFLGGVTLDVGGSEFHEPVPGPLGRLALAYLVLHRGRPVTPDELAEVLWSGEDLPQTWESSLRGVLFRLRRALDAMGVPGAEALQNTFGCYVLRLPAGTTVDVEEAAHLLERARASLDTGLPDDAQRAAAAATEASRAEFLPGAHGAWFEQRQAAVRQVRLSALEVLCEAATAAADYPAAVAAAEEAVAEEPYREPAHALLMRAHRAAGNRAEAVRAYERCKLFLRRDLGVGPSPSTLALQRSILGGGEDEVPSLVARSTATNLPTAMSSFVGRERLLDELDGVFTRTRLLTVTGPAGVGKSRLALELGHRLLAGTPDGVWLVELADLTAAEQLPQHVLAALRLPESGGRRPAESLAQCLAERRMVVILDNCEHLVDACVSLVCDLLRASSGLRVLVTSREPLRVSGECVRVVPMLCVPPTQAVTDFEAAMAHDSVRLLVDRVLAVSPQHPLQPPSALVRICRQLDGLPLALELAAAHARLVPLDDIARYLEKQVPVVTQSLPASPERHRTLERALDWSHDRLSAPERALFARLSVFNGGFTLAAVEAMFPSQDVTVVELLSALVDKSLVLLEGRAGTMRYRLLETTREYAARRLAASGDIVASREAHLAWFTGYAQTVDAELEGPLQDKWLDTLEIEHDNLRAALSWAAASPSAGAAARGAELALALSRFWEVKSYFTEGRSWLEKGARAAVGQSDLAAKCLNAAGTLAFRQCDYGPGRRFHRTASEAFERLGNRPGVAVAVNGLANIDVVEGDFASAHRRYTSVIELGRQLGDDRIVAAGLLNVGVVVEHMIFAGRSGREAVAPARRALSEALDLYRQQGNIYGIAVVLENLGVLVGIDGDDDEARRYLGESLAISRHLGNRKGVAGTVRFLGQLEFRRGCFGAARVHLEECVSIEQQLGATPRLAEAVAFLAAIAEQERRLT
ncbi:MAG TPA: BTAD domain-containing putative transcriptional regulator [Acidimicrobiales bacterium]|nr:BTAD domain-containing putative transcriptional regulator [Acidimicrobiales bacterium]